MLFAQFWQWLSDRLTDYVSVNVAATAAAIEPAAVSLAVIYVMVWGFLHLRGAVEEPVLTGAVRIVRLVVVFGVGLRLWQYNAAIVDTFFEAPVQLAAATSGAADPVATVDTLWDRGGAVAAFLWEKGGVFNGDVGLLPRRRDRVRADGCGVRVHAVSHGARTCRARGAARHRTAVHRAAALRWHETVLRGVGGTARELRVGGSAGGAGGDRCS